MDVDLNQMTYTPGFETIVAGQKCNNHKHYTIQEPKKNLSSNLNDFK